MTYHHKKTKHAIQFQLSELCFQASLSLVCYLRLSFTAMHDNAVITPAFPNCDKLTSLFEQGRTNRAGVYCVKQYTSSCWQTLETWELAPYPASRCGLPPTPAMVCMPPTNTSSALNLRLWILGCYKRKKKELVISPLPSQHNVLPHFCHITSYKPISLPHESFQSCALLRERVWLFEMTKPFWWALLTGTIPACVHIQWQ